MTEQELLKKSSEALARARQRPAKEQLQQLIDRGVIDEQGRVQLWVAFLAVIAVKPGSNGTTLEYFRCLKPTLGMPGMAEIDVSRESLASCVREEKRVITAYLDEKQNRWKEGQEIRLTSKGYLRTDDNNEIEEDSLGTLPTFTMVQAGCDQTDRSPGPSAVPTRSAAEVGHSHASVDMAPFGSRSAPRQFAREGSAATACPSTMSARSPTMNCSSPESGCHWLPTSLAHHLNPALVADSALNGRLHGLAVLEEKGESLVAQHNRASSGTTSTCGCSMTT